jgi:hypothetical protein
MASWIRESLDDQPDNVAATRSGRDAVLAFVRTPFAVRCNVVKVWRLLPEGLWDTLGEPGDIRWSRQRERRALVVVGIVVALLILGVSSIGYLTDGADGGAMFPLVGASTGNGVPQFSAGWCYVPWLSLASVLWVALPPLAGWGFVRLVWIPLVAAGKSTAEATLATARHFSGTYLHVYLMIMVGAGLMAVLVRLAPASTERFRWYLWCFLFGESFFVPAAMWLRLVLSDSRGAIFGRSRYWVLATYGVVFVSIPIWGMLIVFW